MSLFIEGVVFGFFVFFAAMQMFGDSEFLTSVNVTDVILAAVGVITVIVYKRSESNALRDRSWAGIKNELVELSIAVNDAAYSAECALYEISIGPKASEVQKEYRIPPKKGSYIELEEKLSIFLNIYSVFFNDKLVRVIKRSQVEIIGMHNEVEKGAYGSQEAHEEMLKICKELQANIKNIIAKMYRQPR